jgi:D-aminopeptidase
LVIDGRPIGRSLAALPESELWADPDAPDAPDAPVASGAAVPPASRSEEPSHPAGSCIAVVATDAPFGPFALRRLATRCGLGLARCGSTGHHGSGEIFAAFSMTRPRPGADDDSALLNACFGAVVEATEEAVLDALFVADTVVGRDGRVIEGLPVDRVLELLAPRSD